MSLKSSSKAVKAFSKNQLLSIYEEMVFIRRFQERIASLYQSGLMGGFCHLYSGQEAIILGAKAASQSNDEYITTYRCHAHAIACGLDPKGVLAELMGRKDGVSKGKGGSMHMFDPAKHFWGGHGIVGGNVPLGTGMAFAHKYRGNDAVTMTFFGDGASDSGAMFESFNMAALWKLPVIYVIENNHYSMGTAKARHSAGELHTRGEPFGIPGKKVDGMNFFNAYEGFKDALDYVRSGKGPMLLELDTYRYRGHSMSDPAKYRTKDEVAEIKESRDPLLSIEAVLLKTHKLTDEDLKVIGKRVKARIVEIEAFAKASPKADLSELYTDVMQATPVEL